MQLRDMERNVQEHYDQVLAERGIEEWALSVNCLPAAGFKTLAQVARRRNPKVCYSTLRRIAQLEYAVRRDPDPNPFEHADILFNGPPDSEELWRLRQVFGAPVRNVGKP